MNGWVACDKPLRISCVGVARAAKRLTGQKRVGHVGTLDPLATGLVTLALGEARKLIPYLIHPTKTYEFAIHWGESRDTDDAEGRITQISSVIPSEGAIQAALPHFIGQQLQVPPLYSAIHINGVRAYHLARKGLECDIPPRQVYIEDLQWLGGNNFRVVCQSGTYVRSLARDMAQFLGTVGHVAWLRRICDGLFSTNAEHVWSCSRDDMPYVHKPESLMGAYPRVDFNDDQLRLFQMGMPVADDIEKQTWVCVYHDDHLRGVAKWEEGFLKPHRFLWV